MDVITYLQSIDWPILHILFGLGYIRSHIDETIDMSPVYCINALHFVKTRCLISNTLCRYLVNNRDTWKSTDIMTLYTTYGLSKVKAINIEIDVTPTIDHMFILLYTGPTNESPSGWYIVQSYIGRYTTIVEPIDAQQLIHTIRRWKSSGVNPVEWKKYFHVDIIASNPVTTHIYTTDRIYIQEIPNRVSSIYTRINKLLNDKDSYIHHNRYRCMIEEYL